ncbi:MAG: adenylyltransferase/cytidyltransferase family protein [Sulfitobacter sp.]
MIGMTPGHRVVLSYGRFDQFNQSHADLLRRLSALGDELIIGCATDDFALFEGVPCIQTYEERRAVLESCRFVSRVLAEETWEQKHTDIVNYNVSVFAMGAEWAGQFDHLRDVTKVQYIQRSMNLNDISGNAHRAVA